MTREAWLLKLTARLGGYFEDQGFPLPSNVRVSCGWPVGRALAPNGKSRTIGQCWSTACSADGTFEVFVSPCISDSLIAAEVLVHELCHAVDGCRHGHKGPFRKIATAVGLTGKMTATQAGPELQERLNALLAKMEPYPHATLDRSPDVKKQGTRMLKVICPECGYTLRTTRQWIERGLPTCACGAEMESPDADGEGEDE